MSVAEESGGLRVLFRRATDRPGERRARLEVEGGSIDELVHSADLLSVSVLWRQPAGSLACIFPDGPRGEADAGADPDRRRVEYVFLDSPGCRVSARLPRACLPRPALRLRVELRADLIPAHLRLPGGVRRPLERPLETVTLALPHDRNGVLRETDLHLVVETRDGARHTFLVGVDRDGTPVATTGYVKDAGSGRGAPSRN